VRYKKKKKKKKNKNKKKKKKEKKIYNIIKNHINNNDETSLFHLESNFFDASLNSIGCMLFIKRF